MCASGLAVRVLAVMVFSIHVSFLIQVIDFINLFLLPFKVYFHGRIPVVIRQSI